MSDEEVIDLYALKVTELKRELASRNLPVSGTKPVLIERLEKYMTEHEGVDVVEEDDYEASKSQEAQVERSPSPVLVEEPEVEELEEKESDLRGGADSPPPQNSISMTEEDDESGLVNSTNDIKANVSHSDIKTMSEENRKSKRSDRFTNSTDNATDIAKKTSRADRFGLTTTSSNAPSSTNSSTSNDKLNARKERFGAQNGNKRPESISKDLGVSDEKSLSAKKARAERFGLTASLGAGAPAAKTTILASGDGDKKAARAKRFGITH